MNKRSRGKKQFSTRNTEQLAVSITMNQNWSIDFMSDCLFCGRHFRGFNIVDDFNREALKIKIDLSLLAQHAFRVPGRIVK